MKTEYLLNSWQTLFWKLFQSLKSIFHFSESFCLFFHPRNTLSSRIILKRKNVNFCPQPEVEKMSCWWIHVQRKRYLRKFLRYLLLRVTVYEIFCVIYFCELGLEKFLRKIFLRILAKFPKINPARFNLALINPLKVIVFCFLLLLFKVLDAVFISFNSIRDEFFTVPTCIAQNWRFFLKDYSLKNKSCISLNTLENHSFHPHKCLEYYKYF